MQIYYSDANGVGKQACIHVKQQPSFTRKISANQMSLKHTAKSYEVTHCNWNSISARESKS